MSDWMRLWCALAVLTLALACRQEAGPGQPSADPDPVDVVLIVVDTLRQDHVGVYGHARATTPSIDAFAADASVYRNAYASSSWTTPSIGALLTSRHPSELGIRRESSRLSEEEWLLSEELRAAGYRTAAVVSHSFCSSRWGFAQGFDAFDESNVQGHDAVTSADVTDRAIELLSSDDDRPVFLFAHYFDPHYTYVEHPAHRFGGPPDGYAGPVRGGAPFSLLNPRRDDLDPDDLAEMRRIYDSEIAHTDRHIGRLLAHLEASERFRRSLVVLTADHGEAFMEHGYLGHGRRIHDVLIRVPLIVRYPGLPPASIETPVSLLDVFPTVVAFIGRELPPSLRGVPLVAPASQERRAPPVVFVENERGRAARGVIVGSEKLVVRARDGRASLYDLERDPGEQVDLAAHAPERVRELRALLDASLAERARPRAAPELELDEEERTRLENLGYLE